MPSQPNWPDDKESVSRTMLYKKITKPLLERQRRARINRCLDELKDLMSAALAAEGENLTKLEKADVLELTVRHLHQLHRDGELFFPGSDQPGPSGRASTVNSPSPSTDRRRYQGGFLACAQQVASYVMKTPGLEPGVGQRLLAHLAVCSQQLGGPGSPTSPTSPKAEVLPLPGPSGMVPLFPSAAGEYSITAQFQVYPRPAAEMSWPSPHPVPPPSGSFKRRPEEDSPHILPPKKQRYRSESSSSGCSPAVAENPPRPSSGGAQPSNPPDSKEGDPMWRPW